MAARVSLRQSENASEAYTVGALALVVSLGVITAALGFEYIGGYLPCPLCLQQRYAYYAAIPLLLISLVAIATRHSGWAALLLAVVAVGFGVNAALGVYQSGAEWAWWSGPQSCGTVQAIGGTGHGILDSLDSTKVIKCDEAQWRFAALSFAGWNAIFSLLLMAMTAIATAKLLRSPVE